MNATLIAPGPGDTHAAVQRPLMRTHPTAQMPTQHTKPKNEGLGAMFYAALIILGLLVILGVIFWMITKKPGIRHSPNQGALPRYESPVSV